jgi:hypothetical protein
MKYHYCESINLTGSVNLYIKSEHPSFEHFRGGAKGRIVEIYLTKDSVKVCNLETTRASYSRLMAHVISECTEHGYMVNDLWE